MLHQRQNEKPTETSYWWILVLAIPAIIENVLQVFIGVVDTYFVGKLGTEAIAAVGVTNLTMNLFISFFLALGVGTTAVVSRLIGAQNSKKAESALKHAVVMVVAIGFLIGGVNVIFARPILRLLGASNTVLNFAVPYYQIVAGPIVFLGLIYVLSSGLRASGDTKTPMKAAFISNMINAILDYILIFGAFGFSGLGIVGAAAATTIARMVNVLLLVVALQKRTGKIKLNLRNHWKIDLDLMHVITKVGIPAAIERLIMRSGQLIYGGMIISIGTTAYAAHNIAGTIETFSYLPGMGFGVAAATLVGQNLGAGHEEKAEEAGRNAYKLSTLFMMVVGGIFFIYARPLAKLFSTDKVVIDQVVNVLRIIALFQPFLCSTLVVTSALQGAGDTKFPMITSLIGIWGIRVIGVYVLGIKMGFGLSGVWLAYALDVTVRGIILFARFKKGKWKLTSVV